MNAIPFGIWIQSEGWSKDKLNKFPFAQWIIGDGTVTFDLGEDGLIILTNKMAAELCMGVYEELNAKTIESKRR